MKNYLLVVSLLFPLYASAQLATNNKQQALLEKGQLSAGLIVGGGWEYGNFQGRITPRLQYLLKDGWSIALEGRYTNIRGPEFRYRGAGLSTRYYFIRDRRLALFGQLGATYGQSTFLSVNYIRDAQGTVITWDTYRDRSNAFQSHAGLGVHISLNQRWSIEGMAERTLTNNIGSSLDYSRWQGNLGVNYRFE
ncbi:autotransporter outer membrane beta-barrel domain-containing protein [Spirosoma utsteinense]|uniref:Outer membrane protein beta-barrel domain-containing protein n=1 Tax=Spirosoma utsteinense TaxID=2585773 RepID=A0ABR6WDD9_9BACT|nr:autotransporter outer membrane beta-barrel domain-containing protein [Spirosoma utsteinense]MBC3785680.1 hypothetical protein [Spirosoma utsteinense]MBC3794585.1 hypothetical protein [Spirosoma utsteinense]